MNVSFPRLPSSLENLEESILREERKHKLKAGTEARIIWADPKKKESTPYSLVYLHGFSASQGEGYPVHVDFARRYGINLYLSRLARHGLDTPDAFKDLTPQDLVDSAARAVAIGQRLGRKVIMMGTSTGASLALYLASKTGKEFLHGLILYSPLVDFYGPVSLLLGNRWGRSLLRIFPGKKFQRKSKIGHPDEAEVWYMSYRLEGVLTLGKLIEDTMTRETFSNVSIPAFVGYYYKNRENQDKIVSVSGILRMYEQLSTQSGQKKLVNFPDAGTHVICSSMLCRELNTVKFKTFEFSENILHLKPL